MLLSLVGFPDELETVAGDPIELSNGVVFPRRWDAIGLSGRVGVRLRWDSATDYPEFRLHVRGASGAATADLQLGSFSVERQGRQMLDIDAFGTAAASATRQVMSAAHTAASFTLGKIARTRGGGAFADSITAAVRAFHAAGDAESLDAPARRLLEPARRQSVYSSGSSRPPNCREAPRFRRLPDRRRTGLGAPKWTPA